MPFAGSYNPVSNFILDVTNTRHFVIIDIDPNTDYILKNKYADHSGDHSTIHDKKNIRSDPAALSGPIAIGISHVKLNRLGPKDLCNVMALIAITPNIHSIFACRFNKLTK